METDVEKKRSAEWMETWKNVSTPRFSLYVGEERQNNGIMVIIYFIWGLLGLLLA